MDPSCGFYERGSFLWAQSKRRKALRGWGNEKGLKAGGVCIVRRHVQAAKIIAVGTTS